MTVLAIRDHFVGLADFAFFAWFDSVSSALQRETTCTVIASSVLELRLNLFRYRVYFTFELREFLVLFPLVCILLVYGIRHVQVFSLAFHTGSDCVIDRKFRYVEKMVDCTEAIKIKSAITHVNLIVSH